MHALVQLLTQLILRQAQRAPRGMPRRYIWRAILALVLGGPPAWVAYSSAYLWATAAHPGIVGLPAFVHAGGPGWLLGVPLVALATVVLVVLPVVGRYGLVCLFESATFALTLAAMATFQGGGTAAMNAASVSSTILTMPATLISVFAAFMDQPPLESPLAIFSINLSGRVAHLRALSASGRRLGWDLTGPRGQDNAYTTSGYFGSGRTISVASGSTMQGNSFYNSGHWLEVGVTARHPLPGARIGRGERPDVFSAGAALGAVGRGLWPIRYAVHRQSGPPPTADWLRRFEQQIASGAPYLRTRRENVQARMMELRYSHFGMVRISGRLGHVEPLADWLIGLAALLEELAPDAPVAPPAPLDLLPPTR